MKNQLLIRKCKLYDAENPGVLTDVAIRDGKIAAFGNFSESEHFQHEIDAGGRTMIPGLIDIHIQGAGGADILDGTDESLKTMSRTLARLGITGFLATTVVKPCEKNHHLRVVAQNVGKNLSGATILGIHLEGPFINPVKCGGISIRSIYPPKGNSLDEILEITGKNLKMMTIAPEIAGNHPIIRQLIDANIIPSFGHSNASYEEARTGFDLGINHVTHIFNAMPPLHHRFPGPLTAIFESETITAQIIGDGVHLHPAIVDMLYRILGKERCICITDGIQAMGLPDGRYIYNGKEYESKNGAATYLDGTLIGTALSVFEIAKRFMRFTGCDLKTAIDTVTIHPAKLLGIDDRKGSLETGKDADIVLLNPDLSVWKTIIGGKVFIPS
ncbi:MAG: N-acetylglucosamine-6-phosphate deacetylase [Candidatus Marinimicrobia bacterium CG08_land_8_20_14_0_20_45_22]|nr:MAG: N-acetylglucosamine-6-phosphate deacetylase [Candidatus Marinimicrobia bacterium CG08_land_8_20_14_0_20_45_22]